ncbi:hypothetical protein H6F51_14375 [Cyanobacteria bacterium FACHB-DQ100]|nr:hypothetical protein [Cyanobacteria bacterium FACHB-DQ100]
MKRQLSTAVSVAIASVLSLASGSAIANQQKTSADTFCSFRHNQTSLRDRCHVEYSGDKVSYLYRIITLRWSDGVITNIELKSAMKTDGRGGVYHRGIAKVDNAEAIFTEGEDMTCFEIPENSKAICYYSF